MEKIAWITGNTCVLWSDIITLLASAAAVFAFLALYLRKEKRFFAAVVWVLLAVPLSWVLSRMAHWYFRPEGYGSFPELLQPLQPGGNVLMGVFAGCFLAALAVRLCCLTRDLPELLDCISLAGCLGISLGRLASWFNSSDRGMVLAEDILWALPVTDPVSGAVQWRLATFLLQAAAAGVIFLVLLVFYGTGNRRRGDTALLFGLLYGASQVVLDSTRYDQLFLRSNGFVSAVQVLAAVAVALAAVVFAVRLVHCGGWHNGYPLLWCLEAGCLGLSGYMEYRVQRYADQAVLSYGIMTGALAGLILLCLWSRRKAARREQEHRMWLQQLQEEML